MGHTHEDIDQAFSVISRALRGSSGRGKRELVSLNTREAFDSFLRDKVQICLQKSEYSIS